MFVPSQAQSILEILPYELLEEVGKHTDYGTYQSLRATCKTLNSFRPHKVCGFEEYRSMLQSRGLEVLKLCEKVDAANADEDMDDEGEEEPYWSMARWEVRVQKRVDFQQKVRLDLSSLTQDRYHYVCSNYLTQEAMRIVDQTLKKPIFFKQIDLAAGSDDTSFAFGFCVYSNDSDLLKLLIETLPTDSAASTLRDVFIFACQFGSRNMVQMLLSDYYFNTVPTVKNHDGLCWASESGNLEVVQLLLADPRFDPSAENYTAIHYASCNQHDKVVQLFLEDPRVDPSAHNNSMISNVVHYGEEITKLLLADPRVDPSANNSASLTQAARYGHIVVVRLLLADGRVDSSANSYEALGWAKVNGHEDVVELLLEDLRV